MCHRISGEATRSCDFAQNQECLRELYAAHTEVRRMGRHPPYCCLFLIIPTQFNVGCCTRHTCTHSKCALQDQVTVYESRNTDSVQSRLVQGSTGLYRACVHLSAAAWSISKATWQLTQALQILKFPLYNLATICFMAVLGGTYQAVLLLTVAISRLSYDLLQVTYLLTVVAAQLAVLAGALTLLLLLTVLPLTAVIAAGWLLYRCLAQQGLVAHRTRAPPASAFWQSRRQNLSQLSRASRNRSRRFWLSLPSCLPVAARSSMIFRLKQMLVTADRISVWILPGKRTLCTICLEGIPQRANGAC